MARTGRPKAVLVLTDEERETLARWARRPSSAQSLALRSKIVLSCADGRTNEAVASELSCNRATVSKWRWPTSTAPVCPARSPTTTSRP